MCRSICHVTDKDQKSGEPAGIAGWRHRLEAGQDLMADLNQRTTKMLDYLVANGFTDVEKIAVTGTSRGGFSALHVSAHDKRIKCGGDGPCDRFDGADGVQGDNILIEP